MTITDIQKTKAGRYALFVDGTFLFSVHRDTYTLTNLTPGLAVDVRRLEELRAADEERSCKDKAMTILSHASQSRGMLLDKLRRYYDPEVAGKAADRMEELGLLDDLDFGLRFGRDLISLRGWGLRRVEQELYRKRLESDVVAAVMEQLSETDEEGDIPRILRLVRKRYYEKIWTQKGLASTIAALGRQGFAMRDIRTALAQIEEEARET